MWFKPSARVAWKNPSGAITLTRRVRDKYQSVYDDWQRQWYEQFPDVDNDPLWFTRPNPEPARGYPPGFLKRDLDAFVLYLASSPDTDGFFWAADRFVTGVDSYEALNAALKAMPGPVEMLILSGECLNVPTEVCGICWREHNDIGFNSAMPDETVRLIHSRVKDNGYFLVGSCHAGNDPALVQEMADRIGRPVAGARGVSRGVRKQLLVHEGIYWTLGAYAEGQEYTLALPSVANASVSDEPKQPAKKGGRRGRRAGTSRA